MILGGETIQSAFKFLVIEKLMLILNYFNDIFDYILTYFHKKNL